MMTDYISIYEKYFFIRFLVIIFLIISMITGDSLYIIITFFLLYLGSFMHCQKCNHQLGRTKNGYATPFSDSICVKCGQDLDSCTVESDEITNKRLEKK